MAAHRPWRLVLRKYLVWLFAGALLGGCGTTVQRSASAPSRAPVGPPTTQRITIPAVPRPVPVWVLGGTPLPLRPDGFGVVRATPPALVNRRLTAIDQLPRPTSTAFTSTISPVPPRVLARSSWQPTCPVQPDQLRYLTMSFRGFDGHAHTGEMLVNADVAQAVVGVFKRLFTIGFPLEEMRITPKAVLNLPPTGDGNNTEAFVCRPTRGQTRWSAHAYGLAIDLNPFDNPYVKDDLVVPELASSYLNRDWMRPGMVHDGGPAVTAFESVGWTWGGRWPGPVDFMHFSVDGQ
ncbi:MAG: M15 family metallopeptidase [Pseudonocardiaceae bacterium]